MLSNDSGTNRVNISTQMRILGSTLPKIALKQAPYHFSPTVGTCKGLAIFVFELFYGNGDQKHSLTHSISW